MVISGMFAASAAYYWAQWWWWRANLASWIAAMVGGPVVYFLLDWLLPQSALVERATRRRAKRRLTRWRCSTPLIAMGLTTAAVGRRRSVDKARRS